MGYSPATVARLTYQDVLRVKGRLTALTGLEKDEFNALLDAFSPALDSWRKDKTLEGHSRQRSRQMDTDSASLNSHTDQLPETGSFPGHVSKMGALFAVSAPSCAQGCSIAQR